MAVRTQTLKQLIFSGIAVSSLLFAGCEFGNKTKTTLTGYDVISGYYVSLPQSIRFEAQIGNTPLKTKNGVVNDIPDFLKAVMSNPTMLYFDDPVEGIGSIRSRLDTANGIPTYINDKLGNFGASSTAASEIPGCRLTQEKVNFGTFTQLASTVLVSGVKARGTLSLDFTLGYTLTGEDIDCNPMRAQFKSCYVDGIGCSTDSGSIFYRPFVKETFDPYINVGLITADDIASFKSIGYNAVYE